MTTMTDDEQARGYIQIDEPLTEEQAEDLKRRFLEAHKADHRVRTRA